MKTLKLLTTVLFAIISLSGCKDSTQKEIIDCADEEWLTEIQLNQNNAWKANPATNNGVEKLEQTLTEFPAKDLKDFHQLANQLTEIINFIIDNCTMKGASHDNLHIWLYPVLEKVKALKQAKSIPEAKEIKASIICSVMKYATYFQ